MLDLRTPNALWASVLVETLVRLGLQTAVISPGSRSTPLTLAFAQHPAVDSLPILDERSASFFALGRSRAGGRGVVLVCTSGTAGANYFPAVIEAQESQVPLLILTADRPPELRDCASGQTIDQQKLFGTYPNYYGELPLPEASKPLLRYLRQAIAVAWHQAHAPHGGPVHLNCPFRDPLAPVIDQGLTLDLGTDFFDHLEKFNIQPGQPSAGRSQEPGARSQKSGIRSHPNTPTPQYPNTPIPQHPNTPIPQYPTGLIIAGPAQPLDPIAYCQAIAHIAQCLGWPVLAEGLSPLRNHGSMVPGLIIHYDAILRHGEHREALKPEQVIQIGPLPTSKELRQWLAEVDPLRWVVMGCNRNQDPLHGRTVQWSGTVADLAATLSLPAAPMANPYREQWQQWNTMAQKRLERAMVATADLFEGKLAWLMPQVLPPGTAVFIANSSPVRDVEWFWPVCDRGLRPHFSRGANGIDGTLSTALGMAHGGSGSVLITGDLALLHDSNGFLSRPQLRGHLTIVLLNNQGGGIFEMLPVAQMEPIFESFFATPQQVDFACLCAAYGVEYERIETWPQLTALLKELPPAGIRLLELRSDRKRDAQRRRQLLTDLARPPLAPTDAQPAERHDDLGGDGFE
ncbi:2-succinyl-5-enolpyruvyl-6-hydroxy-3-cyclohexene-1-carboxylic-acid synthase [Leptolyngbya sp. PCC 6406]|uniref:2-succinyl-5-enolpyruvyl-6-hydroxy-3- cyclohexene-1-carboxylic-acid synthase n=1 Tax=Leptolyngbya sp. PCC 6406 TaxID=1173264 RepID=UPI0002AC2ADF|nr:2-succinyl-5-enolpyruvyl-6-hydroxy-3-cyclohexene-1-carboxylic-acid synthase [Leptolyngbya sp. PCC 6406]